MALAEIRDEAEVAHLDDVLLDHVHAGVCVIRGPRFLYANPCLAKMVGRDVAEMLAGLDPIEIVVPDDRARVLETVRRRTAGELIEPYDIRLLGRGGRILDARVCGRIVRFGGEVADVVTMTDISEVKQAVYDADWRARMLALTEDLCRGASLEIDLRADRVIVSAGFGALVGESFASPAMRRRDVISRVPGADRAAVVKAWRHAAPGMPFELQHRIRRRDGRICIVHHRGLVEPGVAGCAPRGVAILQDVTTQRDTERRLRELASMDLLTGLPNRAGLIERIESRLSPDGPPVTLVAVEVAQIQQVRHGLGFEAGDALAKALADRLANALPAGDVLSRLSSGEFVTMAEEHADADVGAVVSARARAIASALGEPVEVGTTRVFPTHAIGAARSPGDGGQAAALLSSALNAMRAAAEAGAGQVRLASSRGNEQVVRSLALEWALRGALAAGEFRLLYQPQAELRYGGICGVEALLRWHSATLGPVSPVEFIPVAEQSGQIVAIGDWVLRTACAQAAAWKREGLVGLRVHVNVSGAQLAYGDLAQRLQAILIETGADPEQIGVEITESMLTRDAAGAARTLAALRAVGIEISLDDFGTGFSNLSSLRALPIDLIKIDRSYVNDVLAAPEEVSVTRAVITMAHSLQMRVLAEGVETENQLALLMAHRCDAIQGYLLGQPVEAGEIATMLRERRRLPERLFDRPPPQRTLLLVDDEEHIVASLKRSLRRGGYRIVTATSAAEGLQRLAESEVDVIVSDQRMPGMTGVEFLRRAKSLYPHTVRIVLSGYTELQSITDAINEGAIYKFLTKPWEDDLLRANIEEAFRQKEMADENRRLDQQVRTANAELAEVNQRLNDALARRNEELTLVEDRGRSALEVLYNVPVPLIGLDAEGLIAFVNHDAERLLPELRGYIGQYADESLPSSLRALVAMPGDQAIDADVAGRPCRCSCRSIDDGNGRRGRLVAIVPRPGPDVPP